MVHISRTFTVDRPVDVVIGYLADFTHAEQWDPGTQSCTRLDDGPVQVGSTWHNVSKVLGRETELNYRLERLDATHLTFIGSNDTATSTDDITVVAAGTRSEITYDAKIEFSGLAKLASPIMKVEFERLGTQTVKGIAEALSRL